VLNTAQNVVRSGDPDGTLDVEYNHIGIGSGRNARNSQNERCE
jgi:hypothetical protein